MNFRIFLNYIGIIILLNSSLSGVGQTIVSTEPTTRNVILEEFTGVRCPWCPDGHVIANQMMVQYPGRIFVIAYHPSGSGFTTPHNNTDPDLRRTFPNLYYSSGFAGSLFMPGGIVNRIKYGDPAIRMLSRSDWKSKAEEIINELSPVNIALKSVYNEAQQTLTIDIELYYVQEVRAENTYYIFLIENGLITQQSSTSGVNEYTHKRTYREHITNGYWGDMVTIFKFAGDVFSEQYVLDLNETVDPLRIPNCQIVGFVSNDETGEIYTGTMVDADQYTTGLNDITLGEYINIYPNPIIDHFTIDNTGLLGLTEVEIYDNHGRIIMKKRKLVDDKTNLDISGEASGIYYVRIINNKNSSVRKIIKN